MLKRHFNGCRECALESERYSQVREKLRSLPKRMPPAELTTRLRVVASKVRMESFGGASPWSRWRDRVELSLRNLMRPLAVPAVGGLCSAVFLFSTLVPMFKSAYALSESGDIPTMLVTEPMLKFTAPVAFTDGDAVVDLQLDDQGRDHRLHHRERARPAERELAPQYRESLVVHRILARHHVRPGRGRNDPHFVPQQPHRRPRITDESVKARIDDFHTALPHS